MKKLTKKIIIPLTSSLITISIITSTILVTSCSINANTNNNFVNSSNRVVKQSYLYENKLFSSLDDIATYYIKQNPNSVTSNYYLGDINESILDPSSKTLNINNFKPYNLKNIYPAYLNALNIPTHSYEDAKKTYANRGLIDYQYFDFNNNLFHSYDEARQSIINSKIPTGVMYYKDLPINGSQTIDFNPLSKRDLEEFKRIAVKEVNKKIKNENYHSYFDLKFYDNNSNKNYGKLLDRNLIHNFIVNAIQFYFETKYELLKESRYNIRLSLIDEDSWRQGFIINNFENNGPNNIKQIDSDTLDFYDLKFNQLRDFNMFINRSWFTDKNRTSIWDKKTDSRHISEEALIKNFLGCSFEIRFNGNDLGGTHPWSKPDYRILAKGDEPEPTKSYLAFNIDLKIKQDELNFKDNLRTKIDDLISNVNYDSNSLYDELGIKITRNVIDNLLESDSKFNNKSFSWNGLGNQAEMLDLDKIDDYSVKDNELLHSSCLNKDLIEEDNDIFYLDNPLIKGIKYGKSIIDLNKLIDLINSHLFNNKNLNFVIEYNKSPLFNFFVINKNITNYLQYDEKTWSFKIDFKNIAFKNIDFNDNNFYKKLNNVSQNFKAYYNNDIQINEILSDSNFLFDKIDKNLSFNYNLFDKYKEIINENNEILPELRDNVDIEYRINSLIPFYNNLIKPFVNESNFDNLISNQFVDSNEIVVLYKNDSPIDLSYREFLTDNKNISANLIWNNSINLKNSKKELNELISSTTNVEPAKVVVIYDLLGNVINPGVKLTDGEKLSTTSDAIFDSSQTIIDNILRTKLVPKDPKNVFYKKDETDTYHLVRNQVNKIYILKIDGNTFYFPTHYDLMNQLKKNLSLKSERIVYEK